MLLKTVTLEFKLKFVSLYSDFLELLSYQVTNSIKQCQTVPNSTKQYRTVLFLENCHFSKTVPKLNFLSSLIQWFSRIVVTTSSLIRSNILKIFQSTVFGTVWYLVRQQFERITVTPSLLQYKFCIICFIVKFIQNTWKSRFFSHLLTY